MKLLSLFLFFNFSAFANDRQQQQDFIASIKADEIENHILDSAMYQSCYQNFKEITPLDAQKTKISECVQEEIKKASTEDLEKLEGNLGVKDIKLTEAKTTNSLKNYLQERIHDAIHGKGSSANKKLKEMKYVDQKTYFRLYQQQLRRNITVEISKYCLENVGVAGGPGHFLTYNPSIKQDDTNLFDLISHEAVVKDPSENKFIDGSLSQSNHNIDKNGSNKYKDIVKEYNYCDNLKFDSSDSNDPCYYLNARNTEVIDKLKAFEFELYKTNSKMLGNRFLYCKNNFLKNNCEVFRCNNTYDKGSSSAEIQKSVKYCEENLGIAVIDRTAARANPDDLDDINTTDNQGKIACNVIAKLQEYGKTIAKVQELLQELDSNFKVKSGLALNTTFKGEYKEGQGSDEVRVDNITAISSKELISKVDQFDKNKSEIENCIDPDTGSVNTADPNCSKFINEEDIDKIRNASLEAVAETQAYLKRIDELKGKDEEDIKTFLRKHGLDKYVDQVGTLDDDELITLIKTKYKSDRQAVISLMNDKLHDIINKEEDKAEIIQEVTSDKISEIDNKKERIETLFNYSNMVTSYLDIERQDSDGNSSGDNLDTSYIRNIEEQGFDEYAAEEKSNYQTYFDDTSNDGSSSVQDNEFLQTESLLNGLGDFATAD